MRYQIRVGPVVVIAQASVRAVLRAKLPEHLSDRTDKLAMMRNVITRQKKHVRLEPVADLDGSADVVKAGERTVMDV
jgi:hypothetical protein